MERDESIGKWVARIHRLSMMHLNEELQGLGLNHSQVHFLMALHNHGSTNQEHLTRNLCVDKATTTRAFNTLVKGGLVKRSRDPDDRRAYRVELTAKGERAIPRLRKVLRGWTGTLSRGFSRTDRARAIAFLKRMYENALASREK